MTFISPSQHRFFLEALHDTVQKCKEHTAAASLEEIISALQKEMILLDRLYTEYNTNTQWLRDLIDRYQNAQRRARVRLRASQNVYSKL